MRGSGEPLEEPQVRRKIARTFTNVDAALSDSLAALGEKLTAYAAHRDRTVTRWRHPYERACDRQTRRRARQPPTGPASRHLPPGPGWRSDRHTISRLALGSAPQHPQGRQRAR